MITGADAGVSPDLFLGLVPGPVAVAVGIVAAISYVLGEVTGWINGPLSKFLARRADKRDQREVGWRERDRRVDELEQARKYQDERYELVLDEVKSLREQVRIQHLMSDHQRRAIQAHTDWDNQWVPKARNAGMDIPDPPDLYVYLDDEPGAPR